MLVHFLGGFKIVFISFSPINFARSSVCLPFCIELTVYWFKIEFNVYIFYNNADIIWI